MPLQQPRPTPGALLRLAPSISRLAGRTTNARSSPALRYQDVRDDVSDGDVLLFCGKPLLARIVKTFTFGEYSHCGIVASWGGRKMLMHCDLKGGVHSLPVSAALRTFPGDFEWFAVRPEHRDRLRVGTLVDEGLSQLGQPYSVMQPLRAGAHVFFGTPRPAPEALHCSGFVARCFRVAGLPLAAEDDCLLSPSDIARSLVLEPRGVIKHAS